MNIFKVSVQTDPKKASKIMKKIYIDDMKISKLVKKLNSI